MSRRQQTKATQTIVREGIKQIEVRPWGIKDHGEKPTEHLITPQKGTKVSKHTRVEDF